MSEEASQNGASNNVRSQQHKQRQSRLLLRQFAQRPPIEVAKVTRCRKKENNALFSLKQSIIKKLIKYFTQVIYLVYCVYRIIHHKLISSQVNTVSAMPRWVDPSIQLSKVAIIRALCATMPICARKHNYTSCQTMYHFILILAFIRCIAFTDYYCYQNKNGTSLVAPACCPLSRHFLKFSILRAPSRVATESRLQDKA